MSAPDYPLCVCGRPTVKYYGQRRFCRRCLDSYRRWLVPRPRRPFGVGVLASCFIRKSEALQQAFDNGRDAEKRTAGYGELEY